ncbi:MAG TPA: hypothetical protein VI072_19475 [Polyangiaceae bacterium]
MKAICFDLDGTLLRGTTVSRLLGEHLGLREGGKQEGGLRRQRHIELEGMVGAEDDIDSAFNPFEPRMFREVPLTERQSR